MNIKDGRVIDYEKILKNVDDIINALEYDSMRSAGKVKINAQQLNDLYIFRDNVSKKMPKKSTTAPVKKEA